MLQREPEHRRPDTPGYYEHLILCYRLPNASRGPCFGRRCANATFGSIALLALLQGCFNLPATLNSPRTQRELLMITRGLLDQLLKSGQQLLQGNAPAQPGNSTRQSRGATDLLGGTSLGGLLSGAGGGALAAGAMGLLLGNKSARKLGGQALTYGGLAALGVLAYKAYGNWQAQQGGPAQGEPQTLDRLPEAQAEQHSQAILQALIAAAKADGHVDERERQLLEGEFRKCNSEQTLQHWLSAELNKPLDPAAVARAASTPEMAAEMYLASVLMVDQEHFMERAYLNELARQLQLAPELQKQLEAQVQQLAV